MAIGKKLIKDSIKKGIKKIKEQSGAPEPGTVGARKTTPKVAPKPKPKAKAKPKVSPTAGKPRGRPKGSKNKPKAKPGVVANNKGKIAAAAAAAAAVAAGTGVAVNRARNRKSSEASTVSFGEAFKAARKKGEGTLFTWNGKSYTAVTKDDLKKKGYDGNELKQYANNKGKARRPIKRIGQGIKKVLLGKDKKFGGDKGLIDFIRGPRSKAKAKAKQGTANKKQTVKVNLRGGGIAAKKMRYGGETRPMGSDPKPMIPERPRPMPQESRVRVRPGMKAGGAVKKYKAGGLAKRGLGKAYMKSKR